eukprot:1218899-Alexandrium_andersonii.AAC.1
MAQEQGQRPGRHQRGSSEVPGVPARQVRAAPEAKRYALRRRATGEALRIVAAPAMPSCPAKHVPCERTTKDLECTSAGDLQAAQG